MIINRTGRVVPRADIMPSMLIKSPVRVTYRVIESNPWSLNKQSLLNFQTTFPLSELRPKISYCIVRADSLLITRKI